MRPKKPAPNVTFFDDSVLPSSQLKVWDRKPIDDIGERYRQARLGDGPVCSWAYGPTWQAAEKLVDVCKERRNCIRYGT